MEVPAIRQYAETQWSRADGVQQRINRVRGEVKQLSKEQTAKRQESFRHLYISTEHAYGGERPETNRVVRELRVTRQLTNEVQNRQQHLYNLERRLGAALSKAAILLDLARRARGGRIYAKHQAEHVIGLTTRPL